MNLMLHTQQRASSDGSSQPWVFIRTAWGALGTTPCCPDFGQSNIAESPGVEPGVRIF